MRETVIHPTAIIGENVKIGKGCYIGPYCIIGGFPEHKEAKENKGVVIGDNVTLTGLVTIDGGVDDTTLVEDWCYFMKHSHVGHDSLILSNVTIAPGAVLGGYCYIGDGVGIGMNASIHQRVIVSRDCFIGAGCVLPRGFETEEGMKYVGVPARCIGKNVKK